MELRQAIRRSGLLLLCALAAAAVAAPTRTAEPRAFPGGPYFTVGCGFSHRNNDDPIVFPGQPGKSHNHTSIGNRSVDAATTAASLRGGASTCGDAGDSSTYWTPTLYVDREPVRPLAGLVYYVIRTTGPARPFPAGLKLVAGDPEAKRPQRLDVVSWGCGRFATGKRFPTVPSCGPEQVLQMRVEFPNCWDGRRLDSGDHASHVTYSSGGRCPGSHPVAMPTITLIMLYPPIERSRAVISSGRFAAHADFINGWEQDVLARLVTSLNTRFDR